MDQRSPTSSEGHVTLVLSRYWLVKMSFLIQLESPMEWGQSSTFPIAVDIFEVYRRLSNWFVHNGPMA